MMETILDRYKEMLWEENKKQNLISRRSNRDDIDEHIADSKALLDFIQLDNAKVIDLGSGAGFPGVIIGCYLPGISMTLVEADGKKSGFLARAARELNLINITVLQQRAEVLGQDPLYREQYDFCTCRAVAELRVVAEYGVPLLKTGGIMAVWKGSNYKEETEPAQNALKSLETSIINIYEYNLPGGKKRALVLLQKQGTTAARFPRHTGIPSKRPL